mmetsp:Transcript_95026/g.283748  ORF Transcript_95026/g.283748 Transcript_95026/m.283748 type:complete len:219 (-) Transcript_95026:977-1633(-)
MLVVHAAPNQVLQDVEGYHAVWLGVLDLGALGGRNRVLAVLLRPPERPRLLPARGHDRCAADGHAGKQTGMEGGLEVPDHGQLLPDPGAPHRALVLRELHRPRRSHVTEQRLRGRLPGQHAGLHGRVAPLDLRHVQEARAAACDHPPGEGELRDGLNASLVEAPGPVGDARASLQEGSHPGVLLEALEFLIRAHVGVRVVQSYNQANVQQIWLHVIDE